MPRTVNGLDEIKALAGQHLGYSEWWEITQDRVNKFADATDDHQWIHVDPERAKTGPFGGPIAHGYLTLSLLIPLWSEILQIEGIKMAVNYGLNRVRFTAPVPVGAKIRLGTKLADVKEVSGGGVEALVEAVVEVEGATKPAVVAEAVYRYYG
jgi:acyl dehydratase